MDEVQPITDIIASVDARLIPHSPAMSLVHRSANSWMRTEVYSSHGIKYARFRWGRGSESWGYVHVAGGACTDEVVQTRRSEVDRLISSGGSLDSILALLRSFENARVGRKRRD